MSINAVANTEQNSIEENCGNWNLNDVLYNSFWKCPMFTFKKCNQIIVQIILSCNVAALASTTFAQNSAQQGIIYAPLIVFAPISFFKRAC